MRQHGTLPADARSPWLGFLTSGRRLPNETASYPSGAIELHGRTGLQVLRDDIDFPLVRKLAPASP